MPKPTNGFHRYDLVDRVIDALPAIGYKIPTEVQHTVIPLILQRRNLLVEAATGTGKTAAYGLPLLSRIDLLKRKTQALILVPSRELALQVEASMRTFCTHEQYRVNAIYGGEDMADSERKVRSGCQVLIAVPGRLKDIVRSGNVDFFWRDIKFLIVDEADKLLEQGFQDILDNLISNIRNFVQVALFSATISKDAEALIRERFAPITTIRLSPKDALKNISFKYVFVDKGQKPRYLAGLLQDRRLSQGLIFCSKREEVYELANFLRAVGRKAESYHGLLDQVEREAILGRFRKKQVEFLVATDLAARGLDVVDLPAVINFSFPDDLEVYLHRCGRTGRAGKKGEVYDLVASAKEEIIVQSFHEQIDIALNKIEVNPVARVEVAEANAKLVKVHLSRGKDDKISPADVVGFLVSQSGVPADLIGTIAVYDNHTIVDIPATFLEMLEGLDAPKLKGKVVKVGRYTLADAKSKSEAVRKSQLGVRDKKELSRVATREKSPKKLNTPERPKPAKKEAKPATKGGTAKAASPKEASSRFKDNRTKDGKSKDAKQGLKEPKSKGGAKAAEKPARKLGESKLQAAKKREAAAKPTTFSRPKSDKPNRTVSGPRGKKG